MSKNSLLVLFVASILFCSSAVQAQKNNPLRLGIGLNAGSTIKDPSLFTLGVDARLQIPLGNSFSAIATTGYYNYFKSDKFGNPNFGVIPLKAGVKYFPVQNFYVAGELGAGIFTNIGGDGNVSFLYSPSVGYAFGSGIDISLKYEDYVKSDYNHYFSPIALRIAYGFKL